MKVMIQTIDVSRIRLLFLAKNLSLSMMITCLCILPIFQCASEEITDNSANIIYSMSSNELKDLLGDSWQLQFKVLLENIEYECISYSFVYDYNRYYFLFSDKGLQSIQYELTIRKTKTVYQDGVKHSIEVPWISEDRINIMLNTPPLSTNDFLGQVEQLQERKASKESKGSSWNLWPISILSVPFLPLAVVNESVNNTKHNKWKKRFNPSSVALGDTESESIGKLGNPTFRIIEDNRCTLAFGPKKTFRNRKPKKISLKRGVEKFWVSIVLEDDKVVSIYSDNFFNSSKIIQYKYFVTQ